MSYMRNPQRTTFGQPFGTPFALAQTELASARNSGGRDCTRRQEAERWTVINDILAGVTMTIST
ncbi:hypothetical protein GCM10027565_46450 [Bordetella tumulicola]